MNNRFQIARDFASSIDSDGISKIILFGSVARGDDNEDSDIDILIVLSKDDSDLKSKIRHVVVDFILETGEVISPHIMSEDHFNKTKDFTFLQNVLSEGIVIIWNADELIIFFFFMKLFILIDNHGLVFVLTVVILNGPCAI